MRFKPISVLLGVAVLALAALVITRLERYDELVDRGFGPAARQNPYLAAQLLAERHGRQVSSHASLAALDRLDQYDVLFLSRSSQIISATRRAALLDWLAEGGRLVVAASYSYPWHSDLLLEHFQLSSAATFYQGRPIYDADGQPIPYDDPHHRDFGRHLTADSPGAPFTGARPTGEPPSVAAAVAAAQAEVPAHERLRLNWHGVELTARFDPRISLEHPWFDRAQAPADAQPTAPRWFQAGSQGTHMAGFDWGRGQMIVLSDGGPFTSEAIAQFDHAQLWRLLLGDGQRLAIIYGAQVPSLWTVMLRYLPEALVAFALWLALWLWRQLPRFGPMTRPQPETRRSRLEHLAARADYLWRGGWQATLLEQARQDLLRRARQRLPEFARLAPEEQCAQLARIAQLDAAAVARALTAPAPAGDTALVATVQLLQRIRIAL